MKSVTLFLGAFLLLLTGCAEDTDLYRLEEETVLQIMGEVAGQRAGHALLSSRSGLVLALPYESPDGVQPPVFPARGLFAGDVRLLDSWLWRWGPGEASETPPGAGALPRPDRVERPVPGGGRERVVMDPGGATLLIELMEAPTPPPAFAPVYDLRRIGELRGERSFHWDEANGALVTFFGDGLAFVIVSNGTWVPGERTHRIEYDRDWPPLGAVASCAEPGLFSFQGEGEPRVAMALAADRISAIQAAREALERPERFRERATGDVAASFEPSRAVSTDSLLTAAVNWDRWYSRAFRTNPDGALLARPPLPYAADPQLEAERLRRREPGVPPDSAGALLLAATLTADLVEQDPEGFLFGLLGLLAYLDETGDEGPVVEHGMALREALGLLGAWAGAEGGLEAAAPVTRWELDLQDAGLPAAGGEALVGLNTLYPVAVSALNRWQPQDPLLSLDVGLRARRGSFRYRLPEALRRYTEAAGPHQEREAREALGEPEVNLAYLSRMLRSPDAPESAGTLARTTLLLEHAPGRVVFHADARYDGIYFQAPYWLACLHRDVYDLAAVPEMLAVYMRGERATWTEGSAGLPGGALVDVDVSLLRRAFAYQRLFGISSNLERGWVAVAPAEDRAFWRGRRTALEVGEGPQQLTVDMDPAEGVYSFHGGSDSLRLRIDLVDLPLEGERLLGSLLLEGRDVLTVRREVDDTGRRTLTLRGVELNNLTRRRVD